MQEIKQEVIKAASVFKTAQNQLRVSSPLSIHDVCRPRWLIWMRLTGDQEVAGSTPAASATYFRTDHEIYFTVIRSLPPIKEVQLSVFGERICTIRVNAYRYKPAQ